MNERYSEFGRCVMDLARKRKVRSQVALQRMLKGAGYDVHDRTLATYLQGKVVVDPALPYYLWTGLKLNKRETRELEHAYTFGQPHRPRRRDKEEVA